MSGEPMPAHDLVGSQLEKGVPRSRTGLQKPGQAVSLIVLLSGLAGGHLEPQAQSQVKGACFLREEAEASHQTDIAEAEIVVAEVALGRSAVHPFIDQGDNQPGVEALEKTVADGHLALMGGPFIAFFGGFLPRLGRNEIHLVAALVKLVLIEIVIFENKAELARQVDPAVAGVDRANGPGALCPGFFGGGLGGQGWDRKQHKQQDGGCHQGSFAETVHGNVSPLLRMFEKARPRAGGPGITRSRKPPPKRKKPGFRPGSGGRGRRNRAGLAQGPVPPGPGGAEGRVGPSPTLRHRIKKQVSFVVNIFFDRSNLFDCSPGSISLFDPASGRASIKIKL